jgi:RHS repeat-associated protein
VGPTTDAEQYNGRVFDPGTGFHDYGARMYWPQIGRFISADSYQGDIRNPASLNRYSYVLNNPYRYVDPNGHDPVQSRILENPISYDYLVRSGFDPTMGYLSEHGLLRDAAGGSLQGMQQSEQNLWDVEHGLLQVLPLLAGTAMSTVDPGAGAGTRNGTPFRSVDDAFANPQSLNGKTPAEVRAVFQDEGWTEAPLSRTDAAGTKFFETNSDGNRTGRMVQWHPGGGHHGEDPYWKVSSPQTGTTRVGPQFPQEPKQ